jgi:hypothetical protein
VVVAGADGREEQRVAGRDVEHPQQILLRVAADLHQVGAEHVAFDHQRREALPGLHVHRMVPAHDAAVCVQELHHRGGGRGLVVAHRWRRERR